MLIAIGLIVLGLLLLVVGGETLLRGAVGLATLLRLTPAVIGLTVVAAGTSVPELAVSGIAAAQGSADIAVSNVVGSNIFNIAVILGICALVRPFPIIGNTVRLEYPALALASVVALLCAWDSEISRFNASLLLALYVAVTAYAVHLVRQQLSRRVTDELQEEIAELTPKQGYGAWLPVTLVLLGIVLLGGGAQATVTGAVQLARLWGWSERIIGLTIVSAGTGLPEVMASIVSSIRGRSDVALGNVIGSNLFNTLVILGVGGLIRPLAVQPQLLHSDFWWMLGITALLCPVIVTGRRVDRWEGVVLLAVYVIYLGVLLSRS